MAAIAEYTQHEGGDWLPFLFGRPQMAERVSKKKVRLYVGDVSLEVHSLRRTDGLEWDAINGIRQKAFQRISNSGSGR